LLKLYFEWRGGAAFDNLQSYHVVGALDSDGAHQTSDTWFDRSGRQREDDNLGGPTVTSVVTPGQSWTRNTSGQIEDDPASSAKAQRAAWIEFGDALRGRAGAKLALLGYQPMHIRLPENTRDVTCGVVRVTFGDANTYDICIDPKSGALIASSTTEGGQTAMALPSDWRMVDGVRMPFLIQKVGDGGNGGARILSIGINEKFSDSLFLRPHPASKASFDGDLKSTAWIDFQLVDNCIEFPITLNGHPVVAWLDSGVSVSTIDQLSAGALGVASRGAGVPLHGVGPSLTTGRYAPGVNIRIGALTLSNLTLGTTDLSELSKLAERPVSVILGWEIFNELAVDIDFAHHRLAFRDPENFEAPAGAVALPLTRDGNSRLVAVSVEGRAPIQAVFDLGDDGAIDLFPDYAQAANLLAGRRTSQSLYGGFGGTAKETDIRLGRVDFAGVDLTDVPGSIYAQRQRVTYSTREQGVLGIDLLKRYRLVVDFSHDRLYAAPDPKAVAEPFEKNRLGLTAQPSGADLLVILVVPGGSSADAGLKEGDKIVAINGKAASLWTHQARHKLGEQPPGAVVKFTLDTGQERDVVLKDYY
jgi:hypothetical protein